MPSLTDEQIAQFKSQHGPHLAAVDVGDAVLVFRKPKRQEYDRWFEKRGESPPTAARELAQQCLVHPSFPELMTVLDDKPAVLSGGDGILDAILELAGLGVSTQKKL
jgi:hypothetical protein